jgi:4'-phosphopantetheinyl transferase
MLPSDLSAQSQFQPANLQENEVDVWYVSMELPAPPSVLQRLRDTLSPQELEKSRAFKRSQDQMAYVMQRGCLRFILSRYVQVPPGTLTFFYGDYGKPYLADYDWQFNLSHSQDRLLVAVSPTTRVGVDIEFHRELSRFDALCQRCLTPTESQRIAKLGQAQRQPFFFHSWTCKEAYLKAIGLGLTHPMHEVEVLLPFLQIPIKPEPALPTTASLFQQGWQIYVWQPEVNYSSALAVNISSIVGDDISIRLQETVPSELVH